MSLAGDLNRRFSQFPQMELRIRNIQKDGIGAAIAIQKFISYTFKASMLVPADSFSFTFASPSEKKIWRDYFQGGDIAELYANDRILATGLIDQVRIETSPDAGEQITVSGRDLMGQLEDQDSVNLNSSMIYGSRFTVQQVFDYLKINTRIQRLRTPNYPRVSPPPLFATQAGESKMTSLVRYMEPLNVIAWTDPDGTLVIGKPNMGSEGTRLLLCDKENRSSNVLSVSATFAEATVPNLVFPIWTEQVGVENQKRLPQPPLKNASAGPARLLSCGHFLQKTVMVSSPQGNSPQALAGAQQLAATPGGSNFLQAYAKREIARQNVRERIVQAVFAGHLDVDGEPFRQDRPWKVVYDRAGIDSKMYAYEVEYRLDPREGQRTIISYCNVGTIVADVPVGV